MLDSIIVQGIRGIFLTGKHQQTFYHCLSFITTFSYFWLLTFVVTLKLSHYETKKSEPAVLLPRVVQTGVSHVPIAVLAMSVLPRPVPLCLLHPYQCHGKRWQHLRPLPLVLSLVTWQQSQTSTRLLPPVREV